MPLWGSTNMPTKKKLALFVYAVVVRVLKFSCISLYTLVFRALSPSHKTKISQFLFVNFWFLIFLPGCSLLPFLNKAHLQIKAIIEGEIKGHHVYCEKNLDLGDGKWGIMCSLGNDMDVKYRVRPIAKDQAQIEFLVHKIKEGHHKVLATSTVMLKKYSNGQTISSNHYGTITALAERLP